MSIWLVTVTLLVAIFAAVIIVSPAGSAPGLAPAAAGDGDLLARRCGMINVGTADRPRMVRDPACGSGR